jgi:NAD(P)-dependent dehydrogenase (short-subunit alcohol dehydrogenase family)
MSPVLVMTDAIRVNAVRPGIVRTTSTPAVGTRADPIRSGLRSRWAASVSHPRSRRAIIWLLSGEASYVTGAILDVSGGR